MIRPLTCVTVLMACGSGLYLYQTKHQAQVVDRQIERAVKAITATKVQTRELAAAWTVLGSPDRLQQLSSQYLSITPVTPSQFVAMADLDSRLPAPRALPPPGSDAPSDTPSGVPADGAAATTPMASTEPAVSPTTPPDAAPRAEVADLPRAPPNRATEPTRFATAKTEPSRTDPARTAPPKLAVAARLVDRNASEPSRPVHDMAQAHPTPLYSVGKPPMVAELVRLAPSTQQRLAPTPITGSVLGMARSNVASPAPLPASPIPFGANSNGN